MDVAIVVQKQSIQSVVLTTRFVLGVDIVRFCFEHSMFPGSALSDVSGLGTRQCRFDSSNSLLLQQKVLYSYERNSMPHGRLVIP